MRGTYVVLAVGSGASQQQHLGALGVAVLTGQVQRRVSCLATERRESDGHRFRPTVGPRRRRPGRRRHLVLGVDVGSGLHQQLDGLAEAVPGHLVQRRVAVLPTASQSHTAALTNIIPP